MHLSISGYDKENHLLSNKQNNRPSIDKEEIFSIIDSAVERNNSLYNSSYNNSAVLDNIIHQISDEYRGKY